MLDNRLGCWPNMKQTLCERLVFAGIQDIEPILGQSCAAVYDVVPTLTQHWFNISCLLGCGSVFIHPLMQMYVDVGGGGGKYTQETDSAL